MGEVCARLSSGKNISAKLLDSTAPYPVYGGNGIRGYTQTLNFSGECALVGRQGVYCGNVRYFKGDAYITEHALVVQAKSEHNTRYLAYLLSLMQLGRLSAQSAQPGISVRVLSVQEVVLPSLPTQRKIAAILSSLDDKIENNNAICKNLEEQLKCLFDLRFRDMIDSRGMSQYTPLASLCERITKGTTPTTLGLPFVDEGINFIKAESITDKHIFDWHRFAKIGPDTHTALNRSQLSENDILFSIAGTLGRFALVDKTILPANTNQAVAIIRADKNKVEPEYLYSFFLAGWHHEYCQKRVQQAVQANLSLTTIKSMPIIMLDEPARREYVAQISPIMQMISQRQLENRSLAILRDALLPKLMSGEIQPKTTSK